MQKLSEHEKLLILKVHKRLRARARTQRLDTLARSFKMRSKDLLAVIQKDRTLRVTYQINHSRFGILELPNPIIERHGYYLPL
jgi:hypothetical protein